MQRLALVLFLLVLFALAYVHWFLPGQIESGVNGRIPHEPYEISARAASLHESLFVADLHSDSLLWKRDLAQRAERGHMDIPRLLEGNVALQVFSATTKSPKGQNYEENTADSDQLTSLVIAQFWPPRTWGSIYERAVYQLEKLKALAARSELTLIESRADLEKLVAARAKGDSQVGAIYLIEGGHPLEGDVENLDRLYDQGLRVVGLTHFFDNELGGSLHGVSGEGLSEFGQSVVKRANSLGLIIDIAHSSPAMVREVLAVSERPLILSHGGMKGHCNTARNLSDELMLEFAEHGGLLGVGFWDAAVCDPTPAGVVAAIRYAIDRLGVEHVALGSDYDGATAMTFDIGEIAVLTEEMLRQGFTEEEIRLVMGGNVQRFFLENLPARLDPDESGSAG